MVRISPRSEGSRVPRTFEDLKAVLANRYGSLSAQLQRIAQYVVDHPDEVALDTVTVTANRIGAQPSSIVRFAQALGYSGFTEMQRVFRAHLVAGTVNYRTRLHNFRPSASGKGYERVLATFVEEGIGELQRLRERTTTEDLQAAVRMMARASEIYLIGQRRSFPVTFYLAYALGRLERRCRLVDGLAGLYRQQIQPASRRDLAIVTSFSPYASEVVDAVGLLNSRSVPMIAITDNPIGPIAQQVEVAFAIQESEDRGFRSLVAPLCLAQSLVVALGLRLERDQNGRDRTQHS